MDAQAKALLDRRLAAGEISTAEYSNLLSLIRGGTPAAVREADSFRIDVNDELTIFSDTLTHRGKVYAFSDIKEVSWRRYKQTINLISIGDNASLRIELQSGKVIYYESDTILFRGKKSLLLEKAYKYLSGATFQIHLRQQFERLYSAGAIDIPATRPIRLSTDGSITDSRIPLTLNIKKAAASNGFFIGYSGVYQQRPDEVAVFGDGIGLTRKKIVFELGGDTAVWKALLHAIAHSKESDAAAR